MNLKYQHDFTGDEDYPLPYVLVYRGTVTELMDVAIHCRTYCQGEYAMMDMIQTEERMWGQSFHFLKKSDAMFCKLRHEV
jgi:hypothetical protein